MATDLPLWLRLLRKVLKGATTRDALIALIPGVALLSLKWRLCRFAGGWKQDVLEWIFPITVTLSIFGWIEVVKAACELLKEVSSEGEGVSVSVLVDSQGSNVSTITDRNDGYRVKIFGMASFVLVVLASLCVSSWLLGVRFVAVSTSPSTPTTQASASENLESSLDDDSQYQLLNLSPEKKAEIDKLKSPLYQIKAKMLDSPEYYKLRVAKDNFRATVEQIEQQYRCLIDTATVTCLAKPPATITAQDIDINVSLKMVTPELSQNVFWVIRDGIKLRVPIVLFVSLTNHYKEPFKIDSLYLEAKSVGGWIDTRMADTLVNNVQGMDKKLLVLQGKNGAFSMKGDYLIPSLYDRVIQPGDTVEGWIIVEYPKGIKYGNSIGDMRISLLAAHHWIASKTFPANPPIFDKINSKESKEFYFAPLDTLITEDR